MTTDSSWVLETTAEALLSAEREAVAAGRTRVCGVDEAGRGPLAGPIVAAAVTLAQRIPGVDDSKRLTEAARETLFETITGDGHAFGIAVIAPDVIDRIGIQQANYRAMAEAAALVTPPPDFLLVDGFEIHGTALPQKRMIKGDQRSQSIAAASILAKVTRDRIMVDMADKHPEYGFDRHKGYATQEHLRAIARYGPSPIHRRSFEPLATRYESGLLFR